MANFYQGCGGKKRIFITGTGRCGSTFLMRLFTILGFYTGFDYQEILSRNKEYRKIKKDFAKAPRSRTLGLNSLMGKTIKELGPSLPRDGDHVAQVVNNMFTIRRTGWTDPAGCEEAVLEEIVGTSEVNPGLERGFPYSLFYHVSKAPAYILQLEEIILEGKNCVPDDTPLIEGVYPDPNLWIDTFIVPLRDLRSTAESAFRRTGKYGGPGLIKNVIRLENDRMIHEPQRIPTTVEEQMVVYRQALLEFGDKARGYNVPVLYLQFDEMVNDREYLYKMLERIMVENSISEQAFSAGYDKATNVWIKGAF